LNCHESSKHLSILTQWLYSLYLILPQVKRSRYIYSILLLWASLAIETHAQSLSKFEFFGDNEIIECKLTSDFRFLRKEKFKTSYQPAEFIVYFANGDSAKTKVKIKARGNFRRKHCLFPPIKIKFSKVNFSESSIKEYNSLKLVTHCRSQSSYTTRLFQEKLIYDMYNLMTPYSMRARMLKINYVDTGSKSSPGWNYGFLIEDIEQVAERNSAKEIKTQNVHMERLNRYFGTLFPTFEYMIGNTDWSVVSLHNIKLLRENNPELYQPIPVPYDFDYSGFVDAPYAIPPELLGIESVTTRVYRGYCRTDDEFQEVFDQFIEKKDEIIALISESQLLDEKSKKNNSNYIMKFYDRIESQKFISKTIMMECRTDK